MARNGADSTTDGGPSRARRHGVLFLIAAGLLLLAAFFLPVHTYPRFRNLLLAGALASAAAGITLTSRR